VNIVKRLLQRYVALKFVAFIIIAW